jgi:hypothetical protein
MVNNDCSHSASRKAPLQATHYVKPRVEKREFSYLTRTPAVFLCGAIMSLMLTSFVPVAGAAGESLAVAQANYDQAVKARTDMQLDRRLQGSRNIGYERQAAHWRSVQQHYDRYVRLEELRLAAAKASSDGKTLPTNEQAELTRLTETLDNPHVSEEARQAARNEWAKVQQSLDQLAPQHSRHLVNLALLRDLNQRSRRLKFYLQEAIRPAEGGYGTIPLPEAEQTRRLNGALKPGVPAPDLGPILSVDGNYRGEFPLATDLDEIVRDTRHWTEEYGDIYFSQLEQKGQNQFEAAAVLASRATKAEQEFAALEKRRLALSEKVVAFLAPFDRDGKFKEVTLPSNQRPKLDADGHPDDLMLCVDPGLGSLTDVLKPLGFNVVNYLFYPPAYDANGQIDFDNQKLKTRDTTIGADAKAGIGLSQPLSVLIHSFTLLGDTTQWDKDPAKSFFLKNDKGESDQYPNIWNKVIRDEFARRLRSLGTMMKDKPNFMFYDKLTWEPAFNAGMEGSRPLRAGYNPEAIAAFRQFLRTKFVSIDRLNKAWRTKYTSFEEIVPPRDPALQPQTWTTPLHHEFELFRQDSYADWLRFCIENLQEVDPGRPVSVEVTSLNLNAAHAVAAPYQLLKQIPAKYVEDHMNNWHGSYTTLQTLYSLSHYTKKIPIEMEYIWTYPRLQHPVSEDDFRITGELGLWRRIVWGRQALQVFGTFDGWGYRHNLLDERFAEFGVNLGATGTVLREAATSIAVGKKRATEFWPILSKTKVTKPRVAVMVPSTSVLNEYPSHSVFEAMPITGIEMTSYERLLTPAQQEFQFVPEEVFASGEEKLSNFRVIVLPYVPYFPDKLAARLEAWVKQGGTLVCSGVPGVRDSYGFPQQDFVKSIFGTGFQYKYSGDDRLWKWSPEFRGESRKRTTELDSGPEGATLFRTTCGKGSVILSTVPLDTVAGRRLRLETLLAQINRTSGGSLAVSDHGSYEMVTREDATGQRYLFITNPTLEQPRTDFVTLEGEYQRVVDLGIGSHCEVPQAPRTLTVIDTRHNVTSYHTDGSTILGIQSIRGYTTLQMRLAPGEATVLKLEK